MGNIDTINYEQLVNQGALFFVSHSGGKDSQVMYAKLRTLIPHDQIVVVHAHLGESEWEGVIEHIENTTCHELHIANPIWRDGRQKSFLGMVQHRFESNPNVPSWPSPSNRQCTSDLKRGPIQKVIRRIAAERGVDTVVNCVGYRWQESRSRAKHVEWSVCNELTTATRQAFNWHPILGWTAKRVFQFIAECGQKPHWAYEENERLSCVFCIMGSVTDLKHGASRNPKLLQKYLDAEKETGWTMFHRKSLADVIASDSPDVKKPQLDLCF